MPEKQKEQLISQSAVLSMGFTKSMIEKLLPPPSSNGIRATHPPHP